MTLDEAIKHAEEIAEEQESRGYCDRSVCVIMDENNHNCDECEVVKCRECAEEHRQLARWLKELKVHREAWGKSKRTVKAYLMLEEFGSEYQDDIEKLIEGCRPKEGDAE